MNKPRLTPLTKKVAACLLKLVILGLAFYFIYRAVLKNMGSLQQFMVMVGHLNKRVVLAIMVIVVLLMIANWLLESLKWRYITKNLSPMTVWLAIESVFCGLTWAIFTPNRIGEYGGRIMFLPARKRIHGVLVMGVGAFGQTLASCVLGALSLTWFIYAYVHPNPWLMLCIFLVALAYVALLTILYFDIKWLVSLLTRIKYVKKYHRFFDIISRYKFSELLAIVGFSMARVLAFTIQYYLIIHLLVPQIPVHQIVLAMFAFYFVQSVIPSLDILDIGVRGFAADKIFGYITNQHIAIIVAVSIIYIVNLIIPAILGSVFVLKMKFFERAA